LMEILSALLWLFFWNFLCVSWFFVQFDRNFLSFFRNLYKNRTVGSFRSVQANRSIDRYYLSLLERDGRPKHQNPTTPLRIKKTRVLPRAISCIGRLPGMELFTSGSLLFYTSQWKSES
jgi:hypothetical protein